MDECYGRKMQLDRYEIFTSQDHEKGDFDVKFDIGGKSIYAHKFILKSVSETLNSWLTDRWTKKDEAVKIESYSYDNFYEFLCFLYSGSCTLTNENFREMVDMAEFYGVTYLKEFCDTFLHDLENVTPENVEELYDFAERYSLPFFTKSINKFIFENGDAVIRENNFLSFKKPFVEFFSDAVEGNFKEEFFEAVYNWIEHHAKEQQTSATNNEKINLEEVIKSELMAIFSHHVFNEMTFEFLINFVVEKGFFLTPLKLREIYLPFLTNEYEDEAAFDCVYKMAKKQALKREIIAAKNGESFNVADSIKDDLSRILPMLKFRNKSRQFFMNFVGEKEFILSAGDLAKIYQFGYKIGDEGSRFKFVCELAQMQALQKQKISSDPDNFNLADSIKNDLTEVIPCAELYTVDKQFLQNFVVANGIISEEDVKRVYHTRVQIKNGDQVIAGEFMDDYGIRRKLGNSFSHDTKSLNTKKFRFKRVKTLIPETPSTVMKMKGVLWYLCFEKDGIFTIKHHSIIDRSDYLIAEMGNNDEFKFDPNNRTRFAFFK